jgi:hypothetical protein
MNLQQALQGFECSRGGLNQYRVIQEFIIRFLIFLNNIWDGKESPESWLKTIIIAMHKKGKYQHCENWRGINLLNSGCNITLI